MEDVYLVTVSDGEEDERLRQDLACECHHDIIVGHLHPGLGSLKLELRSDGVGGDEEDEQHQDTRHEHGGKIDIIVGHRVGYLMQVYADGLQHGLYHLVAHALGPHGGLSHTSLP